MIEFKNVSLSIKHKLILSEISVNIPDDRNTVIIGKSGCGKTILMKTMEGLYRPHSGKIIIDSIDITGKADKRRSEAFDKIAMVFQNAALLDSFTVYQNIALPLHEKRQMSPSDIRDEITGILKFVSLEHSSDLYPSELSGGMRKRIGLARAMVTNPKYLILDEPTTGLDPLTAEEVISFLQLVIKNKSVIPITITHDPYCISKLGDHIVMMNEGKILFSGEKQELNNQGNDQALKFYNSFFI